ncbi:LytTR family DNA-binding domain-containing protein [Spirosoma validum]|uniref:LytTR family transcriptional regulator n=1 Tax=Spirosoma validum TaxID=2771355 RepID=A0A927AZA9_9BACT|nr:LytTR family DNA-binding domain-containing protein [Spirosoma validum]MBD2752630.1 LytTR family transcriptional regulator [Spirosoma validum]
MRSAITTYAPGVEAAPGRSLPVIIDRLPRLVLLASVVRIEAVGSRCQVCTQDGRLYPVAGTLVSLARLVPHFWQPHRSHLVNPAYVCCLPGSVRHQGRLLLKIGGWVPVSRRRKEAIYQRLKQLSA